MTEVVWTNGFYTGVPGTTTSVAIAMMADPRLQAVEDRIYQSGADVLIPWYRYGVGPLMANDDIRESTLDRIQTLFLESKIAWQALANGVIAEATQLGSEFPGGNLGRLEVPVHILWGDSDPLFPVSVAQIYNQVIPDSTLQIVEGAGHFVQNDEPELVASAITGAAR